MLANLRQKRFIIHNGLHINFIFREPRSSGAKRTKLVTPSEGIDISVLAIPICFRGLFARGCTRHPNYKVGLYFRPNSHFIMAHVHSIGVKATMRPRQRR
jgi:hypothetical protein